jgi:hypothetical protein
MTADLTAAAKRLAENARPRDELLAELAAAKPFPWLVVGHLPNLDAERIICSHRFEVGAIWCRRRWENKQRTQVGRTHYTVRKAES